MVPVESLIGVQLPDGRLIEYITDGRGRRIAKMINGVIDPRVGRWVSKDAIRFRSETNLFVYSWNDPVNVLDPNGLAPSFINCIIMAGQQFDQCSDSCQSLWGTFCAAIGFPLDSQQVPHR